MIKKIFISWIALILLFNAFAFGTVKISTYHHQMIPLRTITSRLNIEVFYDEANKLVWLDNGIVFDLIYDAVFVNGHWYDSTPFVKVDSGVTMISDYWAHKIFGKEALSEGVEKPFYIAHAGGQFEGIFLTNSKEAIEQSLAAGMEYIEIDFLKTSDDQWVLIHHWPVLKRWGIDVSSAITHQAFKSLKFVTGMTLLDLEDLIELMQEHEQMVIITDTKGDNASLLTHIAYEYPQMMPRIRAQVYNEPEYHLAASLGFEDIILTLYKVYHSNEDVLNFAIEYPLFAVTMPTYKVRSGLAKELSALGVHSYTHTVNTKIEMQEYLELGVSGFYTDTLYYFQKAY